MHMNDMNDMEIYVLQRSGNDPPRLVIDADQPAKYVALKTTKTNDDAHNNIEVIKWQHKTDVLMHDQQIT